MLHGGGNTSVKTRMADITGRTIDVLCVKGAFSNEPLTLQQKQAVVSLHPVLQQDGTTFAKADWMCATVKNPLERDALLVRLLVARQFNVEKATLMLKNWIEWRNANEVFNSVKNPQLVCDALCSPQSQNYFFSVPGAMDKFVSPCCGDP